MNAFFNWVAGTIAPFTTARAQEVADQFQGISEGFDKVEARALLAPEGEAFGPLSSLLANAGKVLGLNEDGQIIFGDGSTFPALKGDKGDTGDMSASLKIKTPRDFGATGYDPLNEVDDSEAMQLFFDHAKNPANARKYFYDWDGEWMVSQTIFACYWDGSDNLTPERHFKCGTLRVAPRASLPGGEPLPVVLEIAGFRMNWAGVIAIHPSGPLMYLSDAWVNRRYVNGVRGRMLSQSTIGGIFVDCPQRRAFDLDSGYPWNVAWVLNGVTFPNSNCIGFRIGFVYGRLVGSTHVSSTSFGISTAITGRAFGGVLGDSSTWFGAEEFDPAGYAFYANSYGQRTKLTVTSTMHMETNDLIKVRSEIPAAVYGTLEYVNATSKVIWTAGDPTLNGVGEPGLRVGDPLPILRYGPNAGVEFTITGFGGVSNREISVSPAPVDMAAASTVLVGLTPVPLVLYGRWSWHIVAQVLDGTHVLVTGYVPNRAANTAYLVAGSVMRTRGGDTANVRVGWLGGLIVATCYNGEGLYAPAIGTILTDYAETTCRLGYYPGQANHIGIDITHGHSEGTTTALLVHTVSVFGRISIQSAFDIEWIYQDTAWANPADFQPGEQVMPFLAIEHFGVRYASLNGKSYEGVTPGALTFNNNPRNRQAFCYDNAQTFTLTYDEVVARRFGQHHWAEIDYCGPAGAGMAGDLVVNLGAKEAALGWTFGGAFAGATGTIAAPAKPGRIRFHFRNSTKKVIAARFDAV